jgi:hypothetical protein
MMSKSTFDVAEELIQAKRFGEARQLLNTLDHPMAKDLLAELDKLDPPKRSKQANAAYDAFLDQWVKTEKLIYQVVAGVFLVFAGYLYSRPPFARLGRASLGDFLPLVLGAAGIFAIWFSTQDDRIRRTLSKFRAEQMRWVSPAFAVIGVIWGILAFTSGDTYRLFFAALFLGLGIMSWWRGKQAENLRQL